MGKKAARHGREPKSIVDKTEALRALRLAREAESRTSGTWGENSVGEILHEGSRSVFVQIWKGARRPDPFESRSRLNLPRGTDWSLMTAWVNARDASAFICRYVARNLTVVEAHKVAEARMAMHRAAGYTVVNTASPSPDSRFTE
jgi:hypothetical protein